MVIEKVFYRGYHMNIEEVRDKFIELFGEEKYEIRTFYAPGRVNLIGEHTDYNGGYVFPCALSFGTFACVRKRNDRIIRFASNNFQLKVDITSDDISCRREHGWTNYPKGVIKLFKENGFDIGGFEVLYDGNIPNGAGLSSSASIELVTAVMLKEMFGCDIDMLGMVKLCQKAENEFIGVNCGIMDQFSIGMGRKGCAIFLNCRTLEYEYAPLKLDGYKLIIANTNKKRGLADSKYNERRGECERAVQYLKRELNIEFLGDIDVQTFEKYRYLIDDDAAARRAEHIIYEDSRVLQAVEKLKNGDIYAFGRLMNESHKSLRDLYEVTGIELDTLAEEAWNTRGVLGSRMTGAGFGGCTVSIVKEDEAQEFINRVGTNYKKRIGLCADFYIAEIGGGAGEI